ncbi:DUF2786 domain-containing protein [Ochrobactrum sp. MR28]|nr:DUF2786 domain-containing protein [Ochrobactrum sp. MR28]MBX8817996.1 DUF2786 domain-containing protein [Ochrobactrum sp. MR31]
MNRETIRKRINALKERTTARGCTEAEAMEAAAKVAELMREHGLSHEELEMTQEAAGVKTSTRSARALLWPTIANCTNSAAIITTAGKDHKVIFVGCEPWPEIAVYLMDVCNNAIDHEVSKFKKDDFYKRCRSVATRRQAVADFTSGLVRRLRVRLQQIFTETMSDDATLKSQSERNRRFPDTSSITLKSHKTRYDDAAGAGWRAGANVKLSHGVNGSQSTKLIGGAA